MQAQQVPTQYVQANGTTFAYRRFGRASTVPLACHNCFRANMDWWDPLLLNTLATRREVILFDNRGIGKTNGEVLPSYQAWADDMIAFLDILNVTKADFLGYSMGARAVQFVALTKPEIVRKLVLAGSAALSPSSKLADITDSRHLKAMATARSAEEGAKAFRYALFSDDSAGQVAFDGYWRRLQERTAEPPLLELVALEAGGQNQMKAIVDANEMYSHRSDDPLQQLKMPTLVANGDNDLTIGTARSIDLFERLENASLLILPKSGHGFLWQFAVYFGHNVNAFLDCDEIE